MRRRSYFTAMLVVFVWGCGPPDAAPVIPPGVHVAPVVSEKEAAEAVGESAPTGTLAPQVPDPVKGLGATPKGAPR